MRRTRYHRNRTGQDRAGMVLVLVLVVVMMLSFAVYSFSSLMVTEYAATTTGLTHLQRRELVNSGLELASLSIRQQASPQSSERLVLPAKTIQLQLPDGQTAAISFLQQLPVDGRPAAFGLRNESAKLNLNTLPLELSRRKEARRRLMVIPGVTVQIADAILDWMDPDDEASEFGAETSYYTAQAPPRKPRQGRFLELSELLQVRGITQELLYGEDQNGNSILDPEENDGARMSPADNGDGFLQRGLSDSLTLLSCESTLLPGGRRKINLNQSVLARLYDQLEPAFGSEVATYVVAWRMRGATYLDEPRPDEGEQQEQRRLQRLESVRKRLESQLGTVDGRSPSLTADQTRRAGLTLSEGAMRFQSLVDLFGGQVRVPVDGKDTLLKSPWAADPITIRRVLPMLELMLTTVDSDVLPGRISINDASEIVLRTIPGITESVASAIARIQPEIHQTEAGGEFQSVAWLMSRGIVSAAELRAMGSYITTRGDVRSGIAIGQTAGSPSVAAAAFMLDCSGRENRIVALHDLQVMAGESAGLKNLTERSR